jgi:hypothetical protein
MKNGIIISDTGPIFSLALIDKLDLLNSLFDEVYIPKAVWEELARDENTTTFRLIYDFFKDKIVEISGFNELIFIMDYGESEAITLYKEVDASFLLIDDRKARKIAESLGIQCIGTIGLLSNAKDKKLISELKPLFEIFLNNKRYYSKKILNMILAHHGELLF